MEQRAKSGGSRISKRKSGAARTQTVKSLAARILEKLEKKKPDPKLKKRIYDALKTEFPDDTVDVSDGYRDNIHVLVVSKKFDRCSESKKRTLLWEAIIANENLNEDELDKISLLLAYSPKELK